MFDLPETTNVYRPMPKELFYKHLNNDNVLKKTFVEEIGSITWRNTLSPVTMNIKAGQDVGQIAIVEIVLERQAIASRLIEIVNRETFQYTLFVIRYEDWGQFWCCDHQTLIEWQGQLYCQHYYQSDWMIEKELRLQIEGENLDQVYAGFFMQITGKPLLEKSRPVEIVASAQVVEPEPADEWQKRQELEAIIKELEKQIDKASQFRHQLKLVSQLEQVKDEIKSLSRIPAGHVELILSETVNTHPETADMIRPFFPGGIIFNKEWSGS